MCEAGLDCQSMQFLRDQIAGFTGISEKGYAAFLTGCPKLGARRLAPATA